MMRRKIYRVLLPAMLTGIFLTGCQKKWDDHNELTDPTVGKNLFDQVSTNSELSKFAALLTKSGYDTIIRSSKTFTVYAPTNAALASIDPAIENNLAKLRQFVSNHIAYQAYYTNDITAKQRIPMVNGKYHNILGNKIDNATITGANTYAKNGVLQVIDKMLPFMENTWEFVENNALMPAKQKTFLLSLFQNVFDATNAVQIGVTPTGDPIYQPGTDSIRTNIFWRNIYDLRNESKEYTFFVLADNAWDIEVNKYKPFYKTGSPDSTTNLSSLAVVTDFAIDTLYSDPTAIPDTIFSKFKTKLGIDKTAIVQTVKTSNGIVYIMNKLDVLPHHKIKEIVIQTENNWVSSADRRNNTYYRDRYNPVTGKDFRDILVFNHGLALFNLRYRISGVPSMKFKAYWVALHDNIHNLTTTFTQKLGIGSATTNPWANGYTTIPLNNYNEQFIGEFTLATYNPTLDIFLTAANTSVAATNLIVCDYIRLEPSF